MKLSSLIHLVTGLIIALSLLTVASVYWVFGIYNNELLVIDRKEEFKQLGIELEDASNYLTNEARSYVQFGNKTHYDNYWREINETKTRDRVIARLTEMNAPQRELDLIDLAKKNSDMLVQLENQAIAAVNDKDFEAARRIMFGETYEMFRKQIRFSIEDFQKTMNDRATMEAEQAKQALKFHLTLSTLLVIITLVTVVSSLVVIIRRLRPLHALNRAAELVAAGDLRVQPPQLKKQDEVAQLARSISKMVNNLRDLITKANDTTLQVTASSQLLLANMEQTSQAAQQITSTVLEVASGAEVQVHNSEESLRSLEEMSQGIHLIAQTSTNVTEASIQSAETAQQGNRLIQQVEQQMGSINDVTQESNDLIRQLDARSQEIGQIVDSITSIAVQTNLLALNAAIEAARAGEHGRGFSVVAEEVRKLAEQARESASQITVLISEIQQNSARTVASMALGAEEVETGLQLVRQSGEAFERILTAAQSVSDQIQEISASSQEMSAASQQVTATVDELTRIAQRSSANAQTTVSLSKEQRASIRKTDSAVHELAQRAQELQDVINRFEI